MTNFKIPRKYPLVLSKAICRYSHFMNVSAYVYTNGEKNRCTKRDFISAILRRWSLSGETKCSGNEYYLLGRFSAEGVWSFHRLANVFFRNSGRHWTQTVHGVCNFRDSRHLNQRDHRLRKIIYFSTEPCLCYRNQLESSRGYVLNIF